MLSQTKRGQKIERHRRDQIVIFRRTDICAVMRISGLEADAQTFHRCPKAVPYHFKRFECGGIEILQCVLWMIGNPTTPRDRSN